MDEDDSLIAVVAHGLLNEITVVSGLLAQARAHLEPDTPENARAADLLSACERKTSAVVANLRRYTTNGGGAQAPGRVIDLDHLSEPSLWDPT